MNTSHERTNLLEASSSLAGLQAGRAIEASAAAQLQLRDTVRYANQIDNPSQAVLKVRDDGFPFDIGQVGPGDALALEALGVDVHRLLAAVQEGGTHSQEDLEQVDVDGSVLHIDGYGSAGVSLRLHTEDPQDQAAPSPAIRHRVIERFQESPGHQAIAKLSAELTKDLEQAPQLLVTEPFDPYVDALATAQLLRDVELFSYGSAIDQLVQDSQGRQLLTDWLNTNLRYDVLREDTATATMYRWGKAVRKTLTLDKGTNLMRLGFEQYPDALMPEVANQSPAESTPFIETECARELSALLDAAGLMFAPSLQQEMMSIREADRYGSVYTQMSRELAKWVNSPERVDVLRLFVLRDEAFQGSRLLNDRGRVRYDYDDEYQAAQQHQEAEQKEVIEKIITADTSQLHEAARTLLTIAQDVLQRDTRAVVTSDLPVTNTEIAIRNGACFDVAGYYLGAVDYGGLRSVTEHKVAMLEKTHGSHSFLLVEPVVFNGVHLPKGSLMSKAADGWAFLRLTPFVFDRDEDQSATGSEIAKAYTNEERVIQRVGGVSVAHLLEAIS